MPNIELIDSFADELTAIRRDIHEYPEIGFEEVRTSGIVAEKLAAWGIEVHRGIGKTGVVGILKGTGGEGRAIGLRADMDALPMEERTNLPYASKTPNRFHGCGHDGHTTMLLGAARYLAAHPEWVAGKRVLDFGAGSGVAGIAAVKAGALEVVACDLDPLALAACRANAELNQVALSYSADFFAEADRFDLILVADVLYDRANLPLLDHFLSRGHEALVADSRVRDFQHPDYQRLEILEALTLPDLAEPWEFRKVSLYHSRRQPL